MSKEAPQAILKRPAGKEAAQAVLKRPAGKKDGEYWWNEANDEQQVPPVNNLKRPGAAIEEDDGADGASTRDRMKGYYFHQSLKNGSLDGEVKAAWEKAKGNRAKETEVINGVMVKSANGRKYIVDKNAPGFKEVQHRWQRAWSSEEATAMPKALMIAKLGSAEALEDALSSGDVKAVDGVGGKTFYSFVTLKVGNSTGREKKQIIERGMVLDDESYKALEDHIAGLSWSFAYSANEQKAIPRTSIPAALNRHSETITQREIYIYMYVFGCI